MSQQHTPEPWGINEWPQPDTSIAIGAAGTPLIARVILRDVSINGQKANARRIVACVNACAQITTDELESIPSNGGMLGPRDDVARIAKQRNELLAALELMLERIAEPPQSNCSCHLSPPCADCIDFGGEREAFEEAKAVIASVKGNGND